MTRRVREAIARWLLRSDYARASQLIAAMRATYEQDLYHLDRHATEWRQRAERAEQLLAAELRKDVDQL